jgi:hypothetical protein
MDLTLQERRRRHDHVVSGTAGKQPGLEDLVGVEEIFGDPDAGPRFEIGKSRRSDVVGPVQDMEGFRFGRGRGIRVVALLRVAATGKGDSEANDPNPHQEPDCESRIEEIRNWHGFS